MRLQNEKILINDSKEKQSRVGDVSRERGWRDKIVQQR